MTAEEVPTTGSGQGSKWHGRLARDHAQDARATTTVAAEVLRRLRRFLLVLAFFLFGGALVELWLVGHTKDLIQLLAFALAGVGALAVLLVAVRLNSATVRILRVCMLAVVVGSCFGIYEHINGNVAFAREIDPSLATAQLFWRGLQGGNPLLAPGILVVAAVLALSATYRYEVTT